MFLSYNGKECLVFVSSPAGAPLDQASSTVGASDISGNSVIDVFSRSEMLHFRGLHGEIWWRCET